MQIAIESYKNDGVSFTDWFMDNYEKLLEKEKNIMFHSFYAGNGYDESLGDSEIIFEEYYNETYNQNNLTIKTDSKVGLSNPNQTTNNKLNINQNK